MSTSLGSEFNSHADDSGVLVRRALGSANTGAHAGVVNRTHRVVRQRASVMQERRSRVRSLMAPLILCSVLLTLTAFAVWSGLYQYQATEAAVAVQADVASLTTVDANNHFMVLLLWFVPVCIAALGAALFRRHKGGAGSETAR